PGLPLALEAAALARQQAVPEVLLLGNHGLVVAGADCAQVEALLAEVEHRLRLDPRPSPPPRIDALKGLAESSPYRPAASAVVHGIATDAERLSIAGVGSLYPDHVVFLGPAVRVLGDEERPAAIARRAEAEGHPPPALLLVPGRGALLRSDLPPE